MPNTYAPYAWIITTTHQGPNRDGWVGPDDAPRMLLRRVEAKANEGYLFEMRDADEAPLYTGRMILRAGVQMTDDENVAGPLLDFGMVRGARSIHWPGHTEWDVD